LSPVYKVKVRYIPLKRPDVKVIEPILEINLKKEKLPHYFIHKGLLCLHFKDFDYYNDYLSDTIIIWITWWLYFYEIWFVTGNWLGGGRHPDT